MPVNTPHAEYKAFQLIWTKCRDAMRGSEAIKAKGITYLPKLEGATESEYQAYKYRAMFYAAARRTVQGLSGAILRKPPTTTWPEARRDFLQTIGYGKESFDQVLKTAIDEVLSVGRVGFLVDAPEDENGDPYITSYFAENIVNWREDVINGKMTLTMVVLQEEQEEIDPEDYFKVDTLVRFRVLRLGEIAGEEGEGPYYYQEVWLEDPNKSEDEDGKFVFKGYTIPRMNGGRLLQEIPFTFVSPVGLRSTPEEPPLLDLVNVNLSHYCNSADLEHGRHYTALPTPWVAGFDPKETKLRIGSSVAWVTQETDGKAGMLEFSGEGLGHLAKGMERKEDLMAVLGARLLEEQKEGVEAAETVRLRHAGESSSLANISMVVGRAFTNVLRWVSLWSNPTAATDGLIVELNKDFNVLGLSAMMIEKLMIALQSGVISWDTWIYNITRGEILPDGITAEDEATRIDAGLPAGMGVLINEPEAPPTKAETGQGTEAK